ncbi:MAG: ECF RNA polymerase sigma factor SigM [Phycisphaerae bacterium]|nr:RNA polymerase sigma factor [Phycisphaerales bacterium]
MSVQASMVGDVFDLTSGDAHDAQLVARASDDPRAFEQIYRRHYRMVAAYLYRRTGDTHAAEDLAAETFLAAMKSVRSMHARGVPARLWLLRTATNAASRWSRTAARRARRETARARPDESPDPRSDRSEELEAVRAAIERLPERFKAVLCLNTLAGLSTSETATALGVREGTVKSRAARAREMIRRSLGQTTGGAR